MGLADPKDQTPNSGLNTNQSWMPILQLIKSLLGSTTSTSTQDEIPVVGGMRGNDLNQSLVGQKITSLLMRDAIPIPDPGSFSQPGDIALPKNVNRRIGQ